MGQVLFDFQSQRKIFSVSELSREIRNRLERDFSDVWVTGEISNLRPATSGHYYFTLKDADAQLRAVCFRSQARFLKFKPEDGLSVIARGRLTVYETRGEYQLVVEFLEPAGLGALQLAFEQLKVRLAAAGLFDAARKKPLPLLPRTIGIVTSPAGAVVRDILRVLRRRYSNMNVLLYPARVQGEGAAREIAQGVEYFNRRPGALGAAAADVIIVARGGGSLEDLWAFNEEAVARAIAASKIPVISAVGHETDFTIADFVADLRAPTPSAAAEVVVHRKEDFVAELENRERRVSQVIRLRLSEVRERLTKLALHRVFETVLGRLAARAQRVDDAVVQLDRTIRGRLGGARHECLRVSTGIQRYDFRQLLGLKRGELAERVTGFETAFSRLMTERRNRLEHTEAILQERSPLALLNRGYSITRDAAGRLVRDAATAPMGSEISVRLARGELRAMVRERKT
jgi:exodeoxyribonuclease VII large subunit